MPSRVMLASRVLRSSRPLASLAARPYSSKAEDFTRILNQLQDKNAKEQIRPSKPEAVDSVPVEQARGASEWKHMSKKDRNPYDEKTDTYGDKIIPEPYRNGIGGSVLGPRNPDRDLQVQLQMIFQYWLLV